MAAMTAGLGADAAALAAVAAIVALAWIGGSVFLGAAPAAERLGVGVLCLAGAAWLVMLQPLAGASIVGEPWAVRALVVAAVAVALASATSGRPVPAGVVAMGEIGLAGELRRVRDLPVGTADP